MVLSTVRLAQEVGCSQGSGILPTVAST